MNTASTAGPLNSFSALENTAMPVPRSLRIRSLRIRCCVAPLGAVAACRWHVGHACPAAAVDESDAKVYRCYSPDSFELGHTGVSLSKATRTFRPSVVNSSVKHFSLTSCPF